MKKKYILILLLAILFIILGIFASLYVIDHNRMRNNEPVLFSTWGKKYAPVMDVLEETPDTSENPK